MLFSGSLSKLVSPRQFANNMNVNKIFWFQKRNPTDGTILSGYLDCDEQSAFHYIRKSRYFKYVGWSDGRYIKEAAKLIQKPKTDVRTGMFKKEDEKTRKILLKARDDEIEFAKTNKDKTPPRNFTATDLKGNIIKDPYLRGQLKRIK